MRWNAKPRYAEAWGISFRFRPRMVGLVTAALAVLVVLAALALTLGSYHVGTHDLIRALTGHADATVAFVVRELRLPRIMAAVVVGAALAGAGAILQGIVRNPLVSPDVIGINAGASFTAVLWIVAGFDLRFLPGAAFAGALGAAIVIYLITFRGAISPSRLVLVGIGVNAMLNAGVSLLIVRGGIDQVAQAYRWMSGTLYAVGWSDITLPLLLLGAIAPVGMAMLPALRVLQAGDITAQSVGARVEGSKLALIAVACGLSATAVSVAGPIGFVALIVPHIARMIGGPLTGGVMMFAAIIGAILLLGADVTAQHLLPVTLPAGVVTTALGAPYFLYLLYRSRSRA